MPTEDQPVTGTPASVAHTAVPTAPKLVSCHYAVIFDSEARDSFYDLRDAVFAVRVTVMRTGTLKIKLQE